MEQENRQYPVAYPPIPKGVVKQEEPNFEEDKEEYDGQGQQLMAYPPLPHGVVKYEEVSKSCDEDGLHDKSSSGIQGYDEIHRNENLVSYPPIPKGFIKEEPRDEDDHSGEKQIVAYPPIPRSAMVIKEEVTDHEKIDLGFRQVMQLQGGENLLYQSEAKEAPNVAPLVDSPEKKSTAYNSSDSDDAEPVADRSKAGPFRPKKKAADNHEPGSEPGKTTKRKRYDVNDAPMVLSTSRRTLLGRSKRILPSPVKDSGDVAGPIGLSDDEELVESSGPSNVKVRATKRSTSKANRRPEDKEPARPFKCSNCDRSYTVKKHLNRHVIHECNVEPKFRCKECDHHFTLKFNLKKHLLNIHKIDPSQLAAHGIEPKERPVHPFKCGKCERTYKQKCGLYNHEKIECGVDPVFPCTLCDFRTARKVTLRTHLVQVHQVAPSDLDHFQAAALVVRPENPFKCEQCGRSYKGKKTLKRHLIHECGIEKSLKCPQCDFQAKRKSHVNRHVKNVHGEGPAFLPK